MHRACEDLGNEVNHTKDDTSKAAAMLAVTMYMSVKTTRAIQVNRMKYGGMRNRNIPVLKYYPITTGDAVLKRPANLFVRFDILFMTVQANKSSYRLITDAWLVLAIEYWG